MQCGSIQDILYEYRGGGEGNSKIKPKAFTCTIKTNKKIHTQSGITSKMS